MPCYVLLCSDLPSLCCLVSAALSPSRCAVVTPTVTERLWEEDTGNRMTSDEEKSMLTECIYILQSPGAYSGL